MGDRALMQEMKRVMGPKHSAQELPDSLEGAVGHEDILEKFRQLYSALYNSAGTEEQMVDLKRLVESMVDRCHPCLRRWVKPCLHWKTSA